jgi:hypothetical protein
MWNDSHVAASRPDTSAFLTCDVICAVFANTLACAAAAAVVVSLTAVGGIMGFARK